VSDFEPPVVMSDTELPPLWLRKNCTCWLTNNLLKGALQSDLRMCTKKTTFYDSNNTAEKRLRMHQIMKIWRGIWISISKTKTKTCLLIGQKWVKQTRKYSKWVD
jgi:hypothetical protein